MTSEVAICNLALGWLGAKPIRSLSDNSIEARLCSYNYDLLREAVLEDVDWNFARRRMVLTAQKAQTDDEWGEYNRFVIREAGQVLHISRVYLDETERHQSDDWRREGNDLIARNASSLYLLYTRNITDPNAFSAGFVQALAARLAADLAVPLTNSRSLQADMWGLYNSKVAAAAANEGSQGANDQIESGSLTRVRGR
jgi:hypothetical protein